MVRSQTSTERGARGRTVRAALHLMWAVAVLVALGLNALFPLPGQQETRPWAVALMAFPVAGALVLVKRPGNPIGVLLGVVGVAAGVIFIGGWVSAQYPGDWSRYLEAVQAGVVVVQFWAIISLLFLFPTGQAPPGAGRVLHRIFTCWMMGMAVLAVVRPGALDMTGRDNPLGIGPAALRSIFDVGIVSIPIGVVIGIAVLLGRRRGADPVERAQLKWFASSSTLLLAVAGVIALLPEGSWEPLAFVIVVAGFWALPSAIVVAILRYRLFDIDRLVSRSITYVAIVVLLALVYTVTVFLVSSALPRQSSLAVATSTLAVAALFRPLSQRLRRSIDRRFHRTRYDLEREMVRFLATMRDQVELDDLRAGLLAVVGHTLEPSRTELWIRPVRAASHTISPGGAGGPVDSLPGVGVHELRNL